MPHNIKNLDVNDDGDGKYLVYCRNRKKLLYDGLLDTFSVYGEIVSIADMGNRIIHIRYSDKDSALSCYYDLSQDPDFMIELPHKYIIEDDPVFKRALENESKISFSSSITKQTHVPASDNKKPLDGEPKVQKIHFIRRKRKIIQSRAFKRFLISLIVCDQYIELKDDQESLIEEVKNQLRGVSLDFETGFFEEVEDDSHIKELPHLILAKDLHYFQTAKMKDAVDVLITNLPPWYQEVNIYQLICPVVADDFLGIDWYRMYPSRCNECSYPYAVIYLKTRTSAYKLMSCGDRVVLDNHKISICLMEDVENILLEVKNQLYANRK